MPRNRSLTRADFAKTKGFRRLAGVFLTIGYGTIPGSKVSKGAVVVSKKVAKRAVERNRIKRAIRPLLAQGVANSGLSLIVSVRKSALSRDLRAEFETLLGKISRS